MTENSTETTPQTKERETFCATLRTGLEAGLACARECKLNATYHERVLRQAIVALSVFEQQFPEVNLP